MNIPVMPENPRLAFSYVPYQKKLGEMYSKSEALNKGTLFKDLYWPFEEYCNMKIMNPYK